MTQTYKTREVEVQAMELKQYGDFVRAKEWINSTTSSATIAYFQQNGGDLLILAGPTGVVDVPVGSVIVLGPAGEFYAMAAADFKAFFSIVPPPPADDWEGSAATYMPRGKEGKSLLGGAALPIPK